MVCLPCRESEEESKAIMRDSTLLSARDAAARLNIDVCYIDIGCSVPLP